MAEKEMELMTEKKSVAGKIFGAVVAFAAVSMVVNAYGAYRRKIADRKEAATKDSSYKVFEAYGNGKNIDISERFAGADIRCFMGGIRMDLSKADLEKDVYIDLHNTFGGVNIKIPEGVNVSYEGTYLCSGVAKPVVDYEGEEVRTIHITGKILFGGLAIQTMKEESDMVEDYFAEGSLEKEEVKQFI